MNSTITPLPSGRAPRDMDALLRRPTRRRFLGLAGSLALSPIALAVAGCGGGDDAADSDLGSGIPTSCAYWNTLAKQVSINVVSSVLNAAVPGAGSFVGLMLVAFWPSCSTTTAESDVLSRAQIVSIDNQTNAQTALAGVQSRIATYKNYTAQPGNADSDNRDAFITCFNGIQTLDSQFEPEGDEASLLPMFVLYGNLFLSFVSDAIHNQEKWGFSDNSEYVTAGQAFLVRAIPYVHQIFEYSYQTRVSSTAIDYHDGEPFRTANTERTRLILDALDLVEQWPYYLTPVPPAGAATTLPPMVSQREVFYGPYGTGDDSGMITLPMTGAIGFPTSIQVDSGLRLDAVQSTYAANAGPDGVTTTPKMGDGGGGATQVGNAGTITGVDVWSGDIVNGIRFHYSDGSTTALLGGVSGTAQPLGSAASLLSSVFVNGVSRSYGSADTFVAGFMLDPATFKPTSS